LRALATFGLLRARENAVVATTVSRATAKPPPAASPDDRMARFPGAFIGNRVTANEKRATKAAFQGDVARALPMPSRRLVFLISLGRRRGERKPHGTVPENVGQVSHPDICTPRT